MEISRFEVVYNKVFKANPKDYLPRDELYLKELLSILHCFDNPFVVFTELTQLLCRYTLVDNYRSSNPFEFKGKENSVKRFITEIRTFYAATVQSSMGCMLEEASNMLLNKSYSDLVKYLSPNTRIQESDLTVEWSEIYDFSGYICKLGKLISDKNIHKEDVNWIIAVNLHFGFNCTEDEELWSDYVENTLPYKFETYFLKDLDKEPIAAAGPFVFLCFKENPFLNRKFVRNVRNWVVSAYINQIEKAKVAFQSLKSQIYNREPNKVAVCRSHLSRAHNVYKILNFHNLIASSVNLKAVEEVIVMFEWALQKLSN